MKPALETSLRAAIRQQTPGKGSAQPCESLGTARKRRMNRGTPHASSFRRRPSKGPFTPEVAGSSPVSAFVLLMMCSVVGVGARTVISGSKRAARSSSGCREKACKERHLLLGDWSVTLEYGEDAVPVSIQATRPPACSRNGGPQPVAPAAATGVFLPSNAANGSDVPVRAASDRRSPCSRGRVVLRIAR